MMKLGKKVLEALGVYVPEPPKEEPIVFRENGKTFARFDEIMVINDTRGAYAVFYYKGEESFRLTTWAGFVMGDGDTMNLRGVEGTTEIKIITVSQI